MSIKYFVIFEKFTERHFIKGFQKKYKKLWDLTSEILIREFQNFDVLFEKSIAKMIINAPLVKICKAEFKIAGTEQSRHGSGNRCIVALHKNTSTICVLLVYHKNDLAHGNETDQWKQIIKDNYPKYKNLL